MKQLKLLLLPMLCYAVSARAELRLTEVRTAADNVLVVMFKSDVVRMDEVDMTPAAWRVNGTPVEAINRFSTEADACDHHIYLTVPALVNGKTYKIETPHGNTEITFDDKRIFCEAIKTNQAAYSALSKVRFANLAIWLGDGGSKRIEGELPEYVVFEERSGRQIASGKLRQMGSDASSGDFVYRIDLSAVPEGGPYLVSVSGYGVSYPFGVGGDFSRRLSYTSFRALYQQRCGVPVWEPYFWNIRKDPCHVTVYLTYGPIGEARLKVTGEEPSIRAWGGYHDAGDADRRTYHMDVTSTLLTTYEFFPEYFTDRQFNFPDIFDEEFNVIGDGNGVPDIIDEAEWGAMFWEYVQTETGEMPWGTETTGYSPFTTYDREDHLFGTEVLTPSTAAWASGMFYHLARLIAPWKPQRAAELVRRAELAHASLKGEIFPTFEMYYSVEKYLYTGDEAAHDYVIAHATDAFELINTYNAGTEIFARSGWLTSFFGSYIVARDRATDPRTVEIFKAAIKATADKQLGYLASNSYPVGTPMNLSWWGSNTSQGQYAYPMMLQWKLSGEQRYIDGVSQLMDYSMGLNPLGKSFMTGMGFNQVHHPHDRESAYTKGEMGWGNRPGILIFGPGLITRSGECYPALERGVSPRERIYIDNRDAISQSEFTIYQSLCFPAAIYPILSQGGKYNEADYPYGN